MEFVFITSDEPWGDIWHTQLHYAFQLSKRFHVYYIDPPDPWKPTNLFNYNLQSRNINPNLTVIKYKNVLPSFIGRIGIVINDYINEKLLARFVPGYSKQSGLIVWRFDPFRGHFIFRNQLLSLHVYHVIDPIAGYRMDEEMAGKADIVVVTSPKFLSHYKKLNKNVLQVGQGADLEFFRRKYTNSELKAQISYDSILLLGTFSDEIDYRFLHLLAERYPSKLVLIGPDKTSVPEIKSSFNKLKQTNGVHWLGPMNPSAFHIHLVACRIGIISYALKNHERNNLRSPLKVISYLGSEKCIVSNIDCEIPSLIDKAIYIAGNDAAYFNFIDLSFRNQLDFDSDEVKKYLDSIDYNKLIANIFSSIQEPLPPLL